LNRAPEAAFVEHPVQRGGLSEIAMLRGVVFLALVGGAGFSAWTSFQDSSRNPLDWAVGEVHAMVTQPEGKAAEQNSVEDTPGIAPEIEARPVAFQTETATQDDRFTISKDTLAAITCGPWDVSDLGIEAILQEMIRRGWTPPSGAKALEASHNAEVQAVNPDASVPTVITVVVPPKAQSSADLTHVEATSF
jgi:hypothetical protein